MVVTYSSDKSVVLSKNVFYKLLTSDEGDSNLCPKLTVMHIDCKGNDRQRVNTAVQLFSDTVSKALKFKFGDQYAEQSKMIKNNRFMV